MNNRKTGSGHEERAADYLAQKGYEILHRNFRGRYGEIDLIARDPGEDPPCLVFVEVKYRKNEYSGNPLEAVGIRKQRRITGTALWYLCRWKIPEETPCRFDVIGIEGDSITHIKNAFEAS